MSKYAVFVDDGLYDVFDDKERAKEYAAEQREKFRGRRPPRSVLRQEDDEGRKADVRLT